MATIGDLVNRIGQLLQDEDDSAWSADQKRRQLLDEISGLSRTGIFGEILWRQGVAAQHEYTLPNTVIDVVLACYDGRQLYEATERSLALKDSSWEQRAQRPQYFTKELQDQTAVSLVPAPLVSGSSVPELPPLPLAFKIEQNCVLFTTDNPQGNGGEDQDCYVPDWLEDVLVFRAASKLSGDQGDYQDLEKAFMFDQVASLYLSILSTEIDIDAKV